MWHALFNKSLKTRSGGFLAPMGLSLHLDPAEALYANLL
jgi:hypothetical protein